MRRIVAVLVVAGWGMNTGAQVPEVIHYQGRLMDGTNLVQGPVGLSLRLYDAASGGTLLYEDSNTVTVVDGLYTAGIGDSSTFGNLIAALTNQTLYLETVIDGVPLLPREELAAVAYALVTRGMNFTTNNTVILNPTVNKAAGGVIAAALLGGVGNAIDTNANYALIGAGLFNSIEASATRSLIGAGFRNRIGFGNTNAVIAGGHSNLLLAGSADSFLGGGVTNRIEGSDGAVIAGGYGNSIATGSYNAVIAGGRAQRIGTNAFTAAIVGNEVREEASGSFIGAGGFNLIDESAFNAAIVSGRDNTLAAGATKSFIGAGTINRIEAQQAVIGGGSDNIIAAGANSSVIGGGEGHRIYNGAPYSVIPGGRANHIADNATNAFAAGYRAQANHPGTFVWADGQDTDFASTTPNEFSVRASGGIRLQGLVQIGSETNAGTGTRPILVRRVESTDNSPGKVVARAEDMQLQRDGSTGGFVIITQSNRANRSLSAFGINSSGAPVGTNFTLATAPSTNIVFTDAQNVVSFTTTFGDIYNNAEVTQVSISRRSGDYFWVGTLTSSRDQ